MNRIDITTSRLAAAVLGAGVVAWTIAGCAAPNGAASAPVIAPSAVSPPSANALPSAGASAPANGSPSASASPLPVPTASASPSPVASAIASPLVGTSPSPSPSQPRLAAQPVAADQAPHFATPDAAMRYLVAAYNAHDLKSEMHVTTPDARTQLEAERQWVNTFTFDNCQVDGSAGDYICQFDMASKVATASAGTDTGAQAMGEITVLVAPADRPGWYMYGNLGCGG